MQHNPSIVKNENGDFQFLTTELLSDKLHDSVVMIKDLLDTNKKLKDTIYQLSNARRNFELEKS